MLGNAAPEASNPLPRRRLTFDIEHSRVTDCGNSSAFAHQQFDRSGMPRIPVIVADLIDLAALMNAHSLKISVRPAQLSNGRRTMTCVPG
jgi:hypothetical protein